VLKEGVERVLKEGVERVLKEGVERVVEDCTTPSSHEGIHPL
jgi:hypothetical protein